MAGSALSRSASDFMVFRHSHLLLHLLLFMSGSSDDTGRFSQQIAGEDQDDGTDDAQHTHFRPFRLTLAGFIEFREAQIGDPEKSQNRDGQSEHQATIFDIALDQSDPVTRTAGAVLGATGVGNAAQSGSGKNTAAVAKSGLRMAMPTLC
jgi:hypothetical protein